MKMCPICGGINENEAANCVSCGRNLPDSVAESENATTDVSAEETASQNCETSAPPCLEDIAPSEEESLADSKIIEIFGDGDVLYKDNDDDEVDVTAYEPQADACASVPQSQDSEPISGFNTAASDAVFDTLCSIPMMFVSLLSTLATLLFALLTLREIFLPCGYADSVAEFINSLLANYDLQFAFAFDGRMISCGAAVLLALALLLNISMWTAYFSARGGRIRLSFISVCISSFLAVFSILYAAFAAFCIYMGLFQEKAMSGAAYVFAGVTAAYILLGMFSAAVIKSLSKAKKAVRTGTYVKMPSVYMALVSLLCALAFAAAAVFSEDVVVILAFARASLASFFGAYAIMLCRHRMKKAESFEKSDALSEAE